MTLQQDESYELFRRAIVDQDAEAWASVYERFRRLLIVWADRSSACSQFGLDSAEIADQAFTRAWMALTPERFANFPTLPRLLSYLRACVATTVIDRIRQQTLYAPEIPDLYADTSTGPEQSVLDGLERAALWDVVLAAAATQSERVVLVESYRYGLPPRAIYVRHPDLFASVVAVYSTKRNLLSRLQHNHELCQLYLEMH